MQLILLLVILVILLLLVVQSALLIDLSDDIDLRRETFTVLTVELRSSLSDLLQSIGLCLDVYEKIRFVDGGNVATISAESIASLNRVLQDGLDFKISAYGSLLSLQN